MKTNNITELELKIVEHQERIFELEELTADLLERLEKIESVL